MFSGLLINEGMIFYLFAVIILLFTASFCFWALILPRAINLLSKDRNKRPYTTERGLTRLQQRKRTSALIISYLSRDSTRTTVELCSLTGLSQSTVCQYLNVLLKKKKVVRIIRGKWHHYTLPSVGQNVYIVNHNKR